ncbi:MAG: STAS domain-containing protein [Ginsengibacter sp.]
MKVKIDTKEKFHVLTPLEEQVPANMTAEVDNSLLVYMGMDPCNIILNLENVKQINEDTAAMIAAIQQKFYDSNCSMVICNLNPEVEKFLDEVELLENMNVTPTESEAWDIIQMEEIERELL